MLRRIDESKHQRKLAACVYEGCRFYPTAARKARNGMQHRSSRYLLIMQILQQFQMKRPAMPLIGLTEINRNLHGIAGVESFGYCVFSAGNSTRQLNGPRDHGSHQDCPQTKHVVGQDVGCKHRPVSLFKIRHGFKCIAGKRCVRPAEPNGNKQPPFLIGEDPFRCPYQKKSQAPGCR